jgi:hypothetical protein
MRMPKRSTSLAGPTTVQISTDLNTGVLDPLVRMALEEVSQGKSEWPLRRMKQSQTIAGEVRCETVPKKYIVIKALLSYVTHKVRSGNTNPELREMVTILEHEFAHGLAISD